MTIKLNFDGGELQFSSAPKMFEWLKLQYIPCNSIVTVNTPRGSTELFLNSYRPPVKEKREKKFVEFKGESTIQEN